MIKVTKCLKIMLRRFTYSASENLWHHSVSSVYSHDQWPPVIWVHHRITPYVEGRCGPKGLTSPPLVRNLPEKLANEFVLVSEINNGVGSTDELSMYTETVWTLMHVMTHDARTSCKQTLETTWSLLMDGTSRAQNHSFRRSCFNLQWDCFGMGFHSRTLWGLYSTDSVFCFDALCTDVFFLYQTVFKWRWVNMHCKFLESNLMKTGNRSVLLLMFVKNRLKIKLASTSPCKAWLWADIFYFVFILFL